MTERIKKLGNDIDDVEIRNISSFKDNRGSFREVWRKNESDINFVQDNFSVSKLGVLRGIHYQINKPQAHLVTLIYGKIFDVSVDLRRNSRTFGNWLGFFINENHQIFLPKGVAHGFCVLSDEAKIHYKCSDYFDKENEGGIIWNDKSLNIQWPIKPKIISEKDNNFLSYNEVIEKNLLPNI